MYLRTNSDISLSSVNWLVFVTETESVYCAVRTGSLYIIQVVCVRENKQRLFPYPALTDWFLKPRRRVFTARYELNVNRCVIFVFKGLKTAALPDFWPSLFQKNSKADLLNAQSFSFIPVARLTLGFSIKQRQSVIKSVTCRSPARQDTVSPAPSVRWVAHRHKLQGTSQVSTWCTSYEHQIHKTNA